MIENKFILFPSLSQSSPVDRPDITIQPTSQQNVVPGTTVMFTVVATGSDLTYQWQRDGGNLTDDTKYSGTTTATLTVMNVMEEDEGTFMCVVTNIVDGVTSSAAELTVRKRVCVCVCVCVSVCLSVCVWMCVCGCVCNLSLFPLLLQSIHHVSPSSQLTS